mgnify:CR=1 FL=1
MVLSGSLREQVARGKAYCAHVASVIGYCVEYIVN